MHIVSYAQNFEDVLLWRALQHVGPGVYVDIGAQDPVIDSVSRAFYEQGWRGIHVEPTSQYAELLRHDRPDEVVIQAAVSDRSGLIQLYVIPNTGQSTGSRKIAESAGRHGYASTQTTVSAITLDEVFAGIDSPEIHWLKIDVEGFERRVLEGWRDSPLRPWIVLVEATRPLTQVKTHRAWEHLLRAKGYTFVHFDGVNRYYLSPAHRELKQHFRHGPCIWDEYQLPEGSSRAGLLNQQHTTAINRLRAEAEARAAQQSEAVAHAQTNIIELNDALSEVQRTLDHTRAERDQARAASEQVHNDLERTRGERDEARSFFGRALEDLDRTRGERDQARAAFERAQEDLDRTRAEFDKTGAALDRARNDLERDRRERREVQDVLERTQAELDRARAELDRLRVATQNLRAAWSRERVRLVAGLRAFYGSFWWRLSVPLRTPDALLAELAGEIITGADPGPDDVCPAIAGSAEEV